MVGLFYSFKHYPMVAEKITKMVNAGMSLELRMTEMVVTTGAIRRAKLHQQTNTRLLNQQRESTEVKVSHSTALLTPSSPGDIPILSDH